ncbi:hypothetical protein [Modicisalibacter sp. 'Wilcox']|uniref:hypothetical protein n=1 Tax=Modicisalibacter sp. 'Wilcox' TaxID=2679914 RepID=UPI0013D5A6EE|nr:hypothetical protein [Modicisalibacter sp. 'Wilcox']
MMTPNDRYQLSRATLSGCAGEMESTARATRAITDLLRLDHEEELALSPHHRDGLLTALDLMADSLLRRAAFAQSNLHNDFERQA